MDNWKVLILTLTLVTALGLLSACTTDAPISEQMQEEAAYYRGEISDAAELQYVLDEGIEDITLQDNIEADEIKASNKFDIAGGGYEIDATFVVDIDDDDAEFENVRNIDEVVVESVGTDSLTVEDTVVNELTNNQEDARINIGEGSSVRRMNVNQNVSTSRASRVQLAVRGEDVQIYDDDNEEPQNTADKDDLDHAFFLVENVAVEDHVDDLEPEDEIEVTADVVNIGDEDGEQNIKLYVYEDEDQPGDEDDYYELELDADEEDAVTLTYEVKSEDVDEEDYVFKVESDNTEDYVKEEVTIIIKDERVATLNVKEFADQLPDGETEDADLQSVEVAVENTSDVKTDNLTVDIKVTDSDGAEVASDSEDPDDIQDEETTVTFFEDDDAEELVADDYDAEVKSEADNAGEVAQDHKFTVVDDETEEAEVNVEFELEHSFPAAEVDDYYDLESVSSGAATRNDIREVETQMRPADAEEPNEIIIGMHDMVSLQETGSILQEKDYKVLDRNEVLNALLVKPPSDFSLEEAMQDVRTLSSIKYVEPNEYFYAISSVNHPNDEHYPLQWHYPQIRLPQAWEMTEGSDDVSIAVLDTGVDTSHPDLGDNVDEDSGYNFIDDNDDFTDYNGHGTHVAGTIGADTDNIEGVAGVMWESRIIPVKVLGDGGGGDLWTIADGMLYAAGLDGYDGEYDEDPLDDPADIINLSLGGPIGTSHMKETVERIDQEDIIMIAAAGNQEEDEDRNRLMYPAAYDEVISVGAVNLNHPKEPELTDYSYYHSDLDILAPGGAGEDSNNSGNPDGVYSTHVEEDYDWLAGTSMAAPHVSGVAGLMLSEEIPPEEVREILKNTAMDLSTVDYDAGLVNSYWAVNDVDSINADLYRVVDGDLERVKRNVLPLDKNETEFEVREPGEYKVKIWIDVQNTGSKAPGDYVGIKGPFEIDLAQEYDIDLNIEEHAD